MGQTAREALLAYDVNSLHILMGDDYPGGGQCGNYREEGRPLP